VSARKIIIDTDPGQDDAVALLLAFASPELDVLGITCVAGNVPLPLTTKNALIVCELAGRTDTQLPDPKMALQDAHAVDFIIDTLRAEPAGTITLCPLGPLTNIATAFTRAPDIVERVQKIVLMGGAYFQVGNITPTAEFNIYVGVPVVVMPLDVTHKALTTRPRVEAFRALGTEPGRMVAEWTDFFERFDKEKYGSAGAPLHDPCVIAYLLQPDLFQGREVNVMIETTSELTMGMTVADWWRVTDRAPNAMFMGDVDADGFFKLLTDRIGRL